MGPSSPESSESEERSPTVCYLCRQRKTRCDRQLPRCGFCIKAKVECQYVSRTKKRGLRAGYVSELESRIGKLEQELATSKETPRDDPPRQALVPLQIAPAIPFQAVTQTPLSTGPSFASPQSSHSTVSDVGDVVSDLVKLPRAFFFSIGDLWFKSYSTWAPFLTQEQIQVALAELPVPVDHIDDIVLKAVVALEICYSTQAICLGYKGRQRVSSQLRSQVLIEAIGKPSVSSLQALLIIALLDYGSDNISSTYSIMAISRRMAENIGLFRQLLKRIEGESPSQLGPPARDHCGDELAIAVTWCILALDAVSSLGVPWRDASAALVDHLNSIAFISTPDFRDSFRTHTHLAAIGLQPVHEFFHSFYRHGMPPGTAPAQKCEEMYLNLMSYVNGLPETSYTILADGAIDFDPCQMFTCLLSHCSIIMIYQRFVFQQDEDVLALSRQRCTDSLLAIVNVIRNISDADTEINSPLVATFIFVAARLELVTSRWLAHERGPPFDILMHGINMCGRRWPLARRYDTVLRAAIVAVESDNPTLLPEMFWDLNKSHLEICGTMKQWSEEMKTSLYLSSLTGPYL